MAPWTPPTLPARHRTPPVIPETCLSGEGGFDSVSSRWECALTVSVEYMLKCGADQACTRSL